MTSNPYYTLDASLADHPLDVIRNEHETPVVQCGNCRETLAAMSVHDAWGRVTLGQLVWRVARHALRCNG